MHLLLKLILHFLLLVYILHDPNSKNDEIYRPITVYRRYDLIDLIEVFNIIITS